MLVLLENRGLVSRRRHPDDGRALRVTITHKGRTTYAKLSAAIRPLQNRLSSPFKGKEINMLTKSLGKVSEAMAQQQIHNNHRKSKKNNHRKGEKL
jgi:DNA-binding MarR family transcriptional regulator